LVSDLYGWAVKAERHVCLVNFNYDMLLDHTMERFGPLSTTDPNSYVRHPHLSLVKPHGSVQWEWPLRGAPRAAATAAPRWAIENATAEDVEDQIVIASDPFRMTGKAQQVGVPAIAVPVVGKQSFVWPPSHARHFANALPNGSRILTIGWRAMEPLFQETLAPLLARKPLMSVVTASESEATGTRGRLTSPDGSTRIRDDDYLDGFANFVLSDRLARFLE
jgi:hypothetical protein